MFKKAFKLEKSNQSHLYNAACSAALSGDTETALIWLEASVDNGWTNVRHMKSDSDLDALHNIQKWEEIVAKAQSALDKIEANYNKPLQQELLKIYEDDQGIRRTYITTMEEKGREHPTLDSLGNLMMEKDEENLEKIIMILDEHGWVGPDVVGGQASQAIFLVIQHADLETQRKYLPMMQEAVEKGNARGSSLALLVDRIALRESRLQTYGSQIGTHPKTKENYVLPLEDPDKVDERRASVGLPPLAEYTQRFGFEWDVEAYKEKLPEFIEIMKGEE